MAKDRDVKFMIKRVNSVMDKLESFLNSVEVSRDSEVEVEKNRTAYKEGLVDGLCMTSWVKDGGKDKDESGKSSGIDYVGGGEGKLLSVVLEEIGSVYGFDGEAEYKRVKEVEKEVDKTGIPSNRYVEIKDTVDKSKVTDMEGKEIVDK